MRKGRFLKIDRFHNFENIFSRFSSEKIESGDLCKTTPNIFFLIIATFDSVQTFGESVEKICFDVRLNGNQCKITQIKFCVISTLTLNAIDEFQ